MSIKKITKYDLIAIVKRIMEFKGFDNEYNVADLLGFKRVAFSERKKRNSIPFEELLIFADSENLNYEWVLTGQGPQRKVKYPMPEANGPYIAETVEIMRRVDRDTQADIRRCAEEKELLSELKKQRESREAA